MRWQPDMDPEKEQHVPGICIPVAGPLERHGLVPGGRVAFPRPPRGAAVDMHSIYGRRIDTVESLSSFIVGGINCVLPVDVVVPHGFQVAANHHREATRLNSQQVASPHIGHLVNVQTDQRWDGACGINDGVESLVSG